MVALGGHVRSLVLIASLALGGCFYIESINQRPSLDISQDTVAPVFRGDEVSFTAITVDPDDHKVNVTWRAYMCSDASSSAFCDGKPVFSGVEPKFAFIVPMTLDDGVTPVSGLLLVLDGKDDHGATAKPTDRLQLPVLDRNPTSGLRATSLYVQQPGPEYPVNTPIELYADYTDGDDPLDTLTVEWKVFPPMQVSVNLTDTAVEQTIPGSRSVAKILRPQIKGVWTVELHITDPQGNTVMKSVSLPVADDRLPCISVVSPIVAPAGTSLPVMDPTLFQVPIVSDDLDSYPKTPGGAEYGEPKFVWSILSPGNSRTVISGATGSGTLFDPATFAPGTQIELRVEIQDRNLVVPNCADAMATCGTPTCIQRQTWKVETR
jgi:hypothetical protein